MASNGGGNGNANPILKEGKAAQVDDHPRLIEIQFPDRVTPFVGLAVGVGVLFAGVALFGNIHSGPGGSLLLAAGIAIILAAFGGQAVVRGRGYVFAGVAGIALGLLGFLEYQRVQDAEREKAIKVARSRNYVEGTIYGVPKPPAIVSLRYGNTVIGNTQDAQPDTFTFILTGAQLSKFAEAGLNFENLSEGNEGIVGIAIPTTCLEKGLGSEEPLHWIVRHKDNIWEIVDRRNNYSVVGRSELRLNATKEEDCKQSETAGSWLKHLSLVSTANAQESSAPVELDFAKIAVELKSDDVLVRRTARNVLSTAEPAQVPEILNILSKEPSEYRTELGVSVALTQLLRRDKSQGATITPLLTDDNRETLLDLSGDKDRTIRVYATEFLYDLGDPGVTKLAIARAAITTDDNARYNWLFAAQDGWQRLDPSAQAALRPSLDQAYAKSGEKTRELFIGFEDK